MSDPAPTAPAVASFDPVEWTKKVEALEAKNKDLEKANDHLQAKVFDLMTEATNKHNESAMARGNETALRVEITRLKGVVAASENLKELTRLRAELAGAHKNLHEKDKLHVEAICHFKVQVEALTGRANRAESKFQALESTAAMMAKSRDNANESATKMQTERDQATEKLALAQADLKDAGKELVELRAAAAQKKDAPAPAAKKEGKA